MFQSHCHVLETYYCAPLEPKFVSCFPIYRPSTASRENRPVLRLAIFAYL